MYHREQISLLIVQLIVIAGLAILQFHDVTSGMLSGGLVAALGVTTGFLIFIRLRSRTGLKHMTAELRRAVTGNVKTRLLAKDDRVWNEVIFFRSMH